MKKIISLFFCVVLLCSLVLTGCGGSDDPIENRTAKASDDNYRNFYEIFTQSFCDSNGDGVGDLKGIISQLDYLNDGDPNAGDDLGIDGLWLTPIMPSPSYHKYDVENYYDIDPAFGTLDTFDELVAECHKRGIKLIIDLVLHHVSSQHPLFIQAVKEVMDGNLDGNAKYFDIHPKDYFDEDVQVVDMGDYACEAKFSLDMPEWNLNSEVTREEFQKIAKFWLDRGVDGFRLDACLHYTKKSTDGEAFLKWFVRTCRAINSDVYIVGETWSDDADIEELYQSGIDSQFAFKFSASTGLINELISTAKGKALISKMLAYDKKMRKVNEDEINALFLSNHDQTRIGQSLGSKGLDYEKFAAAVYMLAPGNSFLYYGEEIGMTGSDASEDASYRTPMVFDSENLQKIRVYDLGNNFEAPPHGGVKQQLADKDSLLNFYRRVIKAKLQNPEIARAKDSRAIDVGDDAVGAFIAEYEGKQVMVIHNFDMKETKQVNVTNEMLKKPEVVADFITGETKIVLKDGVLTMPPHSSAILRTKQNG